MILYNITSEAGPMIDPAMPCPRPAPRTGPGFAGAIAGWGVGLGRHARPGNFATPNHVGGRVIYSRLNYLDKDESAKISYFVLRSWAVR